MMWLSRLILNPRDRRVVQLLADVCAFHNFVMRAWNSHEPRVLFRVDAPHNGEMALNAGVTLLVQSQTQPCWEWLRDPEWWGLLVTLDENPALKMLPLPLPFQIGQTLNFRLRANPTVTRQGRRYGVVRFAEQLAWLQRQGQHAGFTVLEDVLARNEGLVTGKHDEGHTVKFTAVTFEGTLQITDPQAFNKMLQRGLGHGKGFGFGLLSVRRA